MKMMLVLFLAIFLNLNFAHAQTARQCVSPSLKWFLSNAMNIGTYSSSGQDSFASVLSSVKPPGDSYTFRLLGIQGDTYGATAFFYMLRDGFDTSESGRLLNDRFSPYGQYGAYVSGNASLICPTGFRLGGNQCYNTSTGTCGCPAGQRFNPTANICMEVQPDFPDANPDNDNGPNCPTGDGVPQQPVCGNPINPGSGNKIQIESDYIDKTGELSIKRVYNSAPNAGYRTNGKFGAQWSFSYDTKITVTTSRPEQQCYRWGDDGTKFCEYPAPISSAANSEVVTATLADGKKIYFKRSYSSAGDDVFKTDPNVNATLSFDPAYSADVGAAYFYENAETSRKSVFDAQGRILSISDLVGIKQKFTYFWGANDSRAGRYPAEAPTCNYAQEGPVIYGDRILCVADNWGRQINFEYENLPGTQRTNTPLVRITKMITPDGQSYIYSYDGPSGGCETPEGTSAACKANNLTSVTYPDGHIRTYHYNEAAMINSGNACWGSNSIGQGYGGLLNHLTGITDENGARFATWTYDCNGRATSSRHAGDAERVDISYGAMAENGTATRDVTHYTGDPANPIATTRNYRYKLMNGVPVLTLTGEPCIDCDNVATRSYDANGNTTAFTDWNGNSTTFVFDLDRNLETSRVEATGSINARTFSTAWHAKFRLPLKIAEPKRLTTFTYDSKGNLLTRVVQPTSDNTGNQAFSATTVGNARTWTYSYNDVGQVLTITGPRADTTHLTYDGLGNLSSVTNALSQVTSLSNYDANGNVGQIVEPNGVITSLTYTPRGWLSSRTVDAGEISEKTVYGYNGVGQLTSLTQPDGMTTTYTYDDAHRLSSITDNKGNRVEYTYDAMSNRTSERVNDPQNILRRQIMRSYDELNRVHQVIGAKK